MILWEVALLGKIQSRCDGVGSEVSGGKPSVNRALRCSADSQEDPKLFCKKHRLIKPAIAAILSGLRFVSSALACALACVPAAPLRYFTGPTDQSVQMSRSSSASR
jgi:hypothetical protein